MPNKKRKLCESEKSQPSISQIFKRNSNVNVAAAVEQCTGDAEKSKQHFLIELMIEQEQAKNEINLKLSFDFDLHLISGSSIRQFEAESEVEIESAGPSAHRVQFGALRRDSCLNDTRKCFRRRRCCEYVL